MHRLRHPIRAIREPFGTAGLIVAMVALVAALGGTALAAKGALTGKQKKEVETIAKKYAGKPGANGAAGPVGATGPAGAAGKDGTNGTNGTNGSNGAAGKSVVVGSFTKADEENLEPAGEPCRLQGGNEIEVDGSGDVEYACNGKEGSPWTAGGTLPAGKTETGTWSASAGAVGTAVQMPISFNLPLAKAPAKVLVKPGEDKSAEGCPMPANWTNPGIPQAAEGKLCLYQGIGSPGTAETGTIIPLIGTPTNVGDTMSVTCVSAPCVWLGVWAVTAEH